MTSYEAIFTAAARLPADERVRLIDDLSTIDSTEPPTLSSAWLSEIEQRSKEIDAGTANLVAWDEVRTRVRKKVGLDGAN